jgi:predicted nuclease of predicted toxin-antitoxin system
VRFLIDMNLTPRWAPTLAAAGHEAIHWSVVGDAGESDWVICEYARERGFVLITNDLDFPRILAHTLNNKPSIVLLRGEPLVPELRGEGLIKAIDECSAELDAGAILTIDWSDRARARVLPLK